MVPEEKESTRSNPFRQIVLPLIAALIWGVAFVAQKYCTAGPLLFNAARSFVAVLFLSFVVFVRKRFRFRRVFAGETRQETKAMWLGGFLTGTMLAAASFFQQSGLNLGTDAGKAGFITALYIVLVPVVGIFFKRKTTVKTWIAIVIALVGLYLITVPQGTKFTIGPSDLMVLCCTVLFAFQILFIDRYSVRCDPVQLSLVQFLVCMVESLIPALFFETVTAALLWENLLPVLYLGVFSSGIAYTLQIVAQRGTNPAVVSVLLSMESVFSVLAGALLLHERMTVREYIGSAVMLVAVILVALRFERRKAKA